MKRKIKVYYIIALLFFLGMSHQGFSQDKHLILLDLKPDNYFTFKQKETHELYADKEETKLLDQYTKECSIFLRVYKRVGSLMYVRLRYFGLKIDKPTSKLQEQELYDKCLKKLDGEEIDLVIHTTGEVMSIQGLEDIKSDAVKIAREEGIKDTAHFMNDVETFFSKTSMREEFESLLKIYFSKKVKPGDTWNTKLLTDRQYRTNVRNMVKFMDVNEEVYYVDVVSKINSKRYFLQKVFQASEIVGEQHTVYQLDIKNKFPKKLDSIIKYKINPSAEEKFYVNMVIGWERI